MEVIILFFNKFLKANKDKGAKNQRPKKFAHF
jgi:hypothetical protein